MFNHHPDRDLIISYFGQVYSQGQGKDNNSSTRYFVPNEKLPLFAEYCSNAKYGRPCLTLCSPLGPVPPLKNKYQILASRTPQTLFTHYQFTYRQNIPSAQRASLTHPSSSKNLPRQAPASFPHHVPPPIKTLHRSSTHPQRPRRTHPQHHPTPPRPRLQRLHNVRPHHHHVRPAGLPGRRVAPPDPVRPQQPLHGPIVHLEPWAARRTT